MDSVGEGEGGKIWENGIETCEMSCMKRDASPGSMHDAGCLGLVHWDDPEGWYGEGGGRNVQDGEHMRKKKKRQSAESNPCIHNQLTYDKGAKNIQWEKNNLLYSLRLTISILNKWY